eukprot:TRINITY_DN4914_c0_g1_i1.p2 TRINITY_DN4914_c0_g1~~TRINITY_DN4914_c0_g1_i1.p2  ORF type:complete len:126 (-),score=22.70 TRINITY_DN4914_c0_g1_i1:164-541(-)
MGGLFGGSNKGAGSLFGGSKTDNNKGRLFANEAVGGDDKKKDTNSLGGLFGSSGGVDSKPQSGGLFASSSGASKSSSGGLFGTKSDSKSSGGGLFGTKSDDKASGGGLFGGSKESGGFSLGGEER